MCGISGIVGREVSRSRIEAMVDSQHHRGPDDSGVWIDNDRTVGLGHNRLSIIDLSAAGHQPMTDGNDVWLIFNGEIYNHKELRRQLPAFPYKGNCDSEVILAAWAEWGVSCVKHFVGMFAFAIWDNRKKSLFCARDRLGQKPFHYVYAEGELVFASEIKALLAAGHVAEPNEQSWADYLVHGIYDHDEHTFFKGVNSLPPGCSLEFSAGKVKIDSYWKPFDNEIVEESVSDDEAADKFTDLISESIRLRLAADVPVGINLSGGLDSSLLFTIADKEFSKSSGNIETFTAVFGDYAYDEKIFAERISRRSDWNANYVKLTPEECWAELDKMLWYQEAPVGGLATVAYHKMHKVAREKGILVLLEAQGADELFGGYPYYLPSYWAELYRAGEMAVLRREMRSIPSSARSIWGRHLRAILESGSFTSHYDGTEYSRKASLSSATLAKASPEFVWPAVGGELRKHLWRDTRHTKLPRVLRMNDRLSMASSTELRDPFLDHRVVDFSFTIPSHQKIRDGVGKYVMRHAMRKLVPDQVATASKRMVVTPQREWLRTSLRANVESIIESSSFRDRGWFDVDGVRAAFHDFVDGKGDNSFFIWQWINAELWCRRFID